MNKNEVKRIMMSMRNAENSDAVNRLLGQIDLFSEEDLAEKISKIGDSEERIKAVLASKIARVTEQMKNRHIAINDLFSYGVSDNCIHLHMPIGMKEEIAKNGPSKTYDKVNLYMMDAIETIRNMQKNGFYKFQGKDSIFMISPALITGELKFLKELDFEVNHFKKQDLQNEEYLKENKQASLAARKFGKDKNIGMALIKMDVVNSKDWQEKKNAKIKEIENRGTRMDIEAENPDKE